MTPSTRAMFGAIFSTSSWPTSFVSHGSSFWVTRSFTPENTKLFQTILSEMEVEPLLTLFTLFSLFTLFTLITLLTLFTLLNVIEHFGALMNSNEHY